MLIHNTFHWHKESNFDYLLDRRSTLAEIRVSRFLELNGILMLHNHPSGCCKPSKEDLHVAKKLATACALLGIQLVDFIVVGAYGFTHSVRGYEAEWLSPSYEWINAEIVSSNSKKQEQ